MDLTVEPIVILNYMYLVIFLGTSEFAVPALQRLAASQNFKVQLVISQPDALIGRKKVLTPTSVKTTAEKLNLEILTPKKIKDQEIIKKISALKPDFLILAAYGQILPSDLLACAKYGAVNIHPSLLPKYRGPAPVQYAILNGDKETGVTIILMDQEIDHGPILAQEKIKIMTDETTIELKKRLAEIGAKLLLTTLPQFIRGEIKPKSQDHEQATFTKILTRTDARINWGARAQEIYNKWRAFQPWPGVYTETRQQRNEETPHQNPPTGRVGAGQTKRIILNKIKLANKNITNASKLQIGEVLTCDDRLFIKCAAGFIEIEQLQIEGRKEISAQEFLNGYPEIVGTVLS